MAARAVGFIGLGSMGGAMASTLSRALPSLAHAAAAPPLRVWTRSDESRAAFVQENDHAVAHESPASLFADSNLVFLCLSTSAVVQDVLAQSAPGIKPGTIIVDCTSGDPDTSRDIAAMVAEEFDASYMDMPVSGGPAGATKGILAAMVGGDSTMLDEQVRPYAEPFASNIVHVGPVGAGHAVKSINNTLNMLNLLSASEGLLALKRFGVDPAQALSVINTASGRSLQSMVRIPTEVLSDEFNYGFQLGLMRKDVDIGGGLMANNFPEGTLLKALAPVVHAAHAAIGGNEDYTCAVKYLEQQAGVELRSPPPADH